MADPDKIHAEGSWVAVDLDGTLAHSDGSGQWQGYDHIGEPIEPMVQIVREYMQDYVTVKIFTARAAMHGKHDHDGSIIDAITPIQEWCHKYLGAELEVTCIKDPGCVLILDDRARQVERNAGEIAPDYNSFKRIMIELRSKLEMLDPALRK